jgi:hypothetical protein
MVASIDNVNIPGVVNTDSFGIIETCPVRRNMIDITW